jgi:hypothetical protein
MLLSATLSSATSVTIYQPIWLHIAEHLNIHQHRYRTLNLTRFFIYFLLKYLFIYFLFIYKLLLPSMVPLSFKFYVHALYHLHFLQFIFPFSFWHYFNVSYLCHSIIMELPHRTKTSCIGLGIIPMTPTLFIQQIFEFIFRLDTVPYYSFCRNWQKFKTTDNSVTGETYFFSSEIYSRSMSIQSEHHFWLQFVTLYNTNNDSLSNAA